MKLQPLSECSDSDFALLDGLGPLLLVLAPDWGSHALCVFSPHRGLNRGGVLCHKIALYVECRYAERHFSLVSHVSTNAECYFAECHFPECRV